jgi:hypothetical protein
MNSFDTTFLIYPQMTTPFGNNQKSQQANNLNPANKKTGSVLGSIKRRESKHLCLPPHAGIHASATQ